MPRPSQPPPVGRRLEDDHSYLFVTTDHARDADSWAKAACVGADPELFFPIGVGDGGGRRLALDYCAACPVQSRCLETALRDCLLHGIWGGTDEHDRPRTGDNACKWSHDRA